MLSLGYLCALQLPHLIGVDPRWGSCGEFRDSILLYEPSVTVTVSRSFCCRLLQPVFDISIEGVTVQDLIAVHTGPSA